MKFLDRFKRKAPTEPPLPEQKRTQEQKKAAETPALNKPEGKGPGKFVPAPAPAPKKPTTSENDLRLELGDFLHRIPAHLLLPGPHDLKSELRFDIGDLSDRIAKGQTTVSLAEIYRRVPVIFRGEILDSDNIEIRFPWQKLAKLVNLAKPIGQQSDAATASPMPALAEKLRSTKKAVRAIKTGESADEAGQTLQAATPPVLPGRNPGAKPATWFSKSTIEAAPAAPVEPPVATGNSGDMSATTPGPLTLKLQTPVPEPVPASADAKPLEPEAGPNIAEDMRFTDLPQETQRRFVTMKGEYERQIAEIQAQRKIISEAKDRANEEIESLKKELDRNLNLLAKEQTASSIGHDLVQHHQREREELLAQIDALKAQIAASPASSTQDSADKDEQLASLTSERDALLQQKAYLSSQLAEMTNRRGAPSGGATSTQSQRQVDELQRRIALLESAQKEAAHELQREKEAKGKIEKLLATADRLQQESALHMDEIKGEMRKDVEAAFRKNIKDLEDQLAAARSVAHQPTVAPALEPTESSWQSEALVQMEADIESYRERMKVLIRERDEAREAALSQVEAISNDEILALKQAIDEAKADAESKRAELEELRNNSAAELEGSRRCISDLQVELAAALEAAQTSEPVSALDTPEFAQLRADYEHANSLLADIRRELAEQVSKQQQLAAEKDARIRELAESLESSRNAASNTQEFADFSVEVENLRARQNEERQQFEVERKMLIEERTKAASGLQELSQSLQQQLQEIIEERDQLKAKLADLAADMEAESQAHEDLLTTLDKDHTSVVQAKEQLARQLAAAEGARQELEQLRGQYDPGLQAENARLRAELDEARQVRDEAQQALDTRTAALHENEASLTAITRDHQEISARLQEFEHLRNSAESESNHKIQELQSESNRLAARLAETEASLAQISGERQDLATNLAAMERQASDLHSSLGSERDALHAQLGQLTSERDMLAADLSASRKQHQQLIASLDNERGELILARERVEKRLSITEREKAELENTLHTVQQAQAGLHDQFHAQAKDIEARHTAQLTATQEELAETRRLIADLRQTSTAERDTLVAQNASLEEKVANLERTSAAALEAERAAFAERLSVAEQERNTLQSSLHEAATNEHAIAALRTERENAVAALAAAERIHASALAEVEQRYRDGLSGPAREMEQLRVGAETLRAELTVARKMQGEVMNLLDKEREQFTAAKAEWARKIESVDEARRQIGTRLDDREQAIRLLQEKLGQTDHVQDRHKADLADLRQAIDAARRENEQLGARAAASEQQLRDEIASLTQKMEQLIGEKHQLNARMEQLDAAHREQLELAAVETRNAHAAREEVAAELEAERTRRQGDIAAALRDRDEALRAAGQELTRIEQELARTRDQRDIFKREKDDLARRVSQVTEQQKRMLDDIATGLGHTPPSAPRPVAPSVIEVPSEEGNIHLQRVRPVPIRPPQVKIL